LLRENTNWRTQGRRWLKRKKKGGGEGFCRLSLMLELKGRREARER